MPLHSTHGNATCRIRLPRPWHAGHLYASAKLSNEGFGTSRLHPRPLHSVCPVALHFGQSPGDGQVVRDWHDLLDFLVAQLDPDNPHNQAWTGATQTNTVMAFLRRLMALTPRLGPAPPAAVIAAVGT